MQLLCRFLALIIIFCSALVIGPGTTGAQGILEGVAGNLTVPFRSYLGGTSSGCLSNGANMSLGLLSTDYTYRSLEFRDGVRFSELSLKYYLPVRVGTETFVTPFALGYLTDLKDQPDTLGFADAWLRFGGVVRTRLDSDLWFGVAGEYDSTRRQGKWYSGGGARLELMQFVGRNLATLRLEYWSESAGDQLLFEKNPSGYQGILGYSHELSHYGPRVILAGAGYSYGTGAGGDVRGWYVKAGVSMAQGLFTLRGSAGRDSYVLNNYSVGADMNLQF